MDEKFIFLSSSSSERFHMLLEEMIVQFTISVAKLLYYTKCPSVSQKRQEGSVIQDRQLIHFQQILLTNDQLFYYCFFFKFVCRLCLVTSSLVDVLLFKYDCPILIPEGNAALVFINAHKYSIKFHDLYGKQVNDRDNGERQRHC